MDAIWTHREPISRPILLCMTGLAPVVDLDNRTRPGSHQPRVLAIERPAGSVHLPSARGSPALSDHPNREVPARANDMPASATDKPS